MALRQHKEREIAPPESGAGDDARVLGPTLIKTSLGTELRRAREFRDYELVAVASALKIRPDYLRAIEDGRYDVLPGRAYAIGFVRAYAGLLGLDVEEALARFKQEANGIDRVPVLTFPSPPPEGRVPGGAVLFASIVLGVLAYGAWYWLTARERSLVELVPEVPARLAQIVSNLAPSGEPVTLRLPRADQAEAAVTRSLPDQPRAALGSASPISPVAAAPSPVAAPSQTASAAGSQPAPPISGESATAASASAEPGPVEEAAEEEDGVAPPPEERPPTAVADSSQRAASATPPRSQLAAVPAAPAVETGGGRVMLRAKEESWVQVRDADNSPVITRVLKPGDFVRVPDRSGLTLLTGNAGALEVLVDGELVPAVGPRGQVRRDIVLDPERLKSGTAAPRS
ncbi:MAG: DUF4115 domain-containing protein [Proteobacteria bacterium]|nr:DUF4115 domain-containing protein [Pseudomonadota bacterium]MBI3496499.1 DUF4115 domain-containing protein [Pseudomonadota bacterium]